MEASSLAKRPRLDPELEESQGIQERDSGEQLETVDGGQGDTERGEREEGEEEEEEEEDEGVEEQMNEFFSELDMDYARQRRNLMTEGQRVPRRKSVLPTHLHSVMGSANLRLARGDTAGAIELCLEVIRQAPHSPEPYLTLSTIYEEMGDTQKLLQILVISAHLKKQDVGLWVKAGHQALELGNLPLSLRCFRQACRLEPDSPSHLWNKASVHQQMNEPGKAVDAYQQLHKMLPPTNGHDIVEVSKELAQLYFHHCNDTVRAIDILHQAVYKYMSVADDEAVHLLVELQISSKLYQNAYELLTIFYNMFPEQSTAPAAPDDRSHDQSHDQTATPTNEGPTFQQMLSSAIRVSLTGDTEGMEGEGEVGKEGERNGDDQVPPEPVMQLSVPEDLPVDLRVKLAVCLVHLSLPLPPSLLPSVLAQPEEYGDLFMDLADAYTENGSPSQALPLLSALVHTQRYNQAGVWLKHAECLHVQLDLEGAAVSYSQVLSLAPHHTNTRLALATMYVQLGRVEDALALLESEHYEHYHVSMDTTEECTNEMEQSQIVKLPEQTDHTLEGLRVLLHRYTVLVNSGRVSEYVHDGTALLAVLFRDVYHRRDLRSIMHLSVKKLQERLRDELGQRSPNVADSLLSLPEWWTLFLTTGKAMLKMGPAYHHRLLHLVLCAATLSKFEMPDMELVPHTPYSTPPIPYPIFIPHTPYHIFHISYPIFHTLYSYSIPQQFALFASSLCCMMKEYAIAFTFIKTVCIKLEQPVFWNLLNSLPLNNKFQKFILRLCFKHPSNLSLLRIHANYSLATSNYKFALCLYHQTYKRLPNDYLTCLCIGSVYYCMASQKWVMGRNQLVLQGMGFFQKYLRLRGRCQESMYNLGRSFHQLGIVHAACHFYRQVLTLEPENNDSQWRLMSDLRPQAAFNLSLIYRASGNHSLARQTLSQYCRI